MMIYVSHSSTFDFRTQLYFPLTEIFQPTQHTLIFPHEKNLKQYPSKFLFQKHKCDLMIAELSYPSTGQGIELGWADAYEIPIIGVAHIGINVSKSITAIIDNVIRYDEIRDMSNLLLKSTLSIKPKHEV